MRRLTKEALLKFDVTPLFLQRRATTLNYVYSQLCLSLGEIELYEALTEYARREFNRVDNQRRGTVGFALTVATVSRNEILTGLNQSEQFILTHMVEVDGCATKTTCISRPFKNPPDFASNGVIYDPGKLLKGGRLSIRSES